MLFNQDVPLLEGTGPCSAILDPARVCKAWPLLQALFIAHVDPQLSHCFDFVLWVEAWPFSEEGRCFAMPGGRSILDCVSWRKILLEYVLTKAKVWQESWHFMWSCLQSGPLRQCCSLSLFPFSSLQANSWHVVLHACYPFVLLLGESWSISYTYCRTTVQQSPASTSWSRVACVSNSQSNWW